MLSLPNLTAVPWHTLEESKVLEMVGSDRQQGLSLTEIAARQSHYGPNRLTAKAKMPAWQRFLLQFNQSLLYILMIAGTVKAFLGSWRNALVIWGVVLINGIISYIQESKAEEAINALAQSVVTEATVIRGGQKLSIPSEELVPGDLVVLNSGDKVPADLRLIAVRNLQVDESALTGES
ncbi:MAG: HAD-IC family P-type ATPase, partial [Thermostichales cyanobacterium SZTDM-1c_bins_54]